VDVSEECYCANNDPECERCWYRMPEHTVAETKARLPLTYDDAVAETEGRHRTPHLTYDEEFAAFPELRKRWRAKEAEQMRAYYDYNDPTGLADEGFAALPEYCDEYVVAGKHNSYDYTEDAVSEADAGFDYYSTDFGYAEDLDDDAGFDRTAAHSDPGPEKCTVDTSPNRTVFEEWYAAGVRNGWLGLLA
jgi:hypothetical protein